MDRNFTYFEQIPLATDPLTIQRNTMVSLGSLAEAVIGNTTQVSGLALSATSPASMTVNVGPGSIFYETVVDSVAYGDLGTDSDPLLKQGINTTSTSLTSITAPTTPGYSQNYLIEVSFAETDGDPVLLPFYNSANVAAPILTDVNTTRKQNVAITVVPGTPAATGTQTTPAATSGWTALYVVTVAYGQTTITSSNWSTVSGAPFVNIATQTYVNSITRTRLTGTTNFYVSPSGSDVYGNGSSSKPWATPNYAANWVATQLDLAGQSCNIVVAAGTYGSIIMNAPCVGGPYLYIQGASYTNTMLFATAGVTAAAGFYNGTEVNISNFTLVNRQYVANTSSASGYGLLASSSRVYMNNLAFGDCGLHQIVSADHSTIVPSSTAANFYVSGNGLGFLCSEFNSYLAMYNATITFQTGVTYAAPTVNALYQSTINLGSSSITNWINGGYVTSGANTVVVGAYTVPATGYTGQRWTAAFQSTIQTSGSGYTWIPGTGTGASNGAIDVTSIYQ